MIILNMPLDAVSRPVFGALSQLKTGNERKGRAGIGEGEVAGVARILFETKNSPEEGRFSSWHSRQFCERLAGKVSVLTDSTFPTLTRSNITDFIHASLCRFL